MLSDVGNVVIFNRSGSVVSMNDNADAAADDEAVESPADSCCVDVRIYPEAYRVIESSIETLRIGEYCRGMGDHILYYTTSTSIQMSYASQSDHSIA